MSAKLVIKAPNQKIEDQTIECEPDWSVLRLKHHLTEIYPTNPKPEEQRLIYAGRLIKDHLALKDFIKFEDGQKYMVHLVCSQHATSSPMHRTQQPPNDLDVPGSSSQADPSTLLRHRTPVTPFHNDSPSISHHSVPAGHQPPGGAPGPVPELVAQQMAAMQHFYAQYMAQFMQQAQLAGFPTAYPDFTHVGMGPVNTPGTPPGAPAENVAPANLNRVQAVANQNVRMNAQGGPLLDDEEDDVENRDWLDWFYIFSRALVLFSILFFYSSLGRFMVVTGVAILIYMYQGGWFGGRVPQLPQRENAAQPQVEQNANPEGEAPPVNQEAVSSADVQREPETDDPAEIQNIMDIMDGDREAIHQESEPNRIQALWLFLTSFFTSLIPEQPPPVNIN